MVETQSLVLFLRNWLSNFAHVPFETDNLHFLQIEQYFMYQKAKFFADEDSMAILMATTPQEARDPKQLII